MRESSRFHRTHVTSDACRTPAPQSVSICSTLQKVAVEVMTPAIQEDPTQNLSRGLGLDPHLEPEAVTASFAAEVDDQGTAIPPYNDARHTSREKVSC
jgi:hypothetical protein